MPILIIVAATRYKAIATLPPGYPPLRDPKLPLATALVPGTGINGKGKYKN